MPSLRAALAAAGVAASAASARAAEPRLVWLPPAADLVPRSGVIGLAALGADERLAPLPQVRVQAEGGEVRPADPGPIAAYRYRATGARLVLRASALGFAAAQTALAIGPLATRVTVTAEPPSPIKNRDSTARLNIAMLGSDGRPDVHAGTPVLRTNVGTLENLAALGPGQYTATYRLPADPKPEVAIVVAFAPWPHEASTEGGFGRQILPLATAFTLGGKTEPDAEVTVEIAGRAFGPVRSDTKGRFQMPVVASPGHRKGGSAAVDRFGNRRRMALDLRLPPTDQIACVANPLRLAADGQSRARILCVATDAYGADVRGAALTASARLGRLEGPTDLGDGTYEWSYLAPGPGRTGAARSDEIAFAYPAGGPVSRESLGIAFAPPPPAALSTRVDPAVVFTNAPGAQVTVAVRDGQGADAASARVFCTAAVGTVAPLGADGTGRTARYLAPTAVGELTTDRVACTAVPAAGTAVAAVYLWTEDRDVVGVALDQAGLPVPGTAVASGSARAVADAAGRFRLAGLAASSKGPNELGPGRAPPRVRVELVDRPTVAALLHLLPAGAGFVAFPAFAPAPDVRAEAEVVVTPATSVDVLVAVAGNRVTWRVVDVATGQVLRDRDVRVDVTNGAAGAARAEKDGGRTMDVTRTREGPVFVNVVDAETGIQAVAELGR